MPTCICKCLPFVIVMMLLLFVNNFLSTVCLQLSVKVSDIFMQENLCSRGHRKVPVLVPLNDEQMLNER